MEGVDESLLVRAFLGHLEMEFPNELAASCPLREVLGLMTCRTAPVAHILREKGWQIPNRVEEEQAVVMHWLISLALKHGDEWGNIADAYLKAPVVTLSPFE